MKFEARTVIPWRMETPDQLRELVEHYLASPNDACELASAAQTIAASETYEQRSSEITDLLAQLL